MKTPFGNTTAAIRLAEMVSTNKKIRRTVSCYYTDYRRMLRSVEKIEDIKLSRKSLSIYRLYYFRLVRESYLPEEIKTYLLNVMSAYHKFSVDTVNLRQKLKHE